MLRCARTDARRRVRNPAKPGNGGAVVGELYKVSSVGLELLDKLEEHPREYKRVRAKVRLRRGPECTAWMYVYQLPVASINAPVPENDWRAFTAKTSSSSGSQPNLGENRW